jgi:hypothetical protein
MSPQKINDLAAEISSSMDNGYSEILNMLNGMNAAAEYIVCLRQVVYSNKPEVVERAKENLNMLGQRWTTYLILHETRMKLVQE